MFDVWAEPLELNSIRQEDKQPMNIKIRLVGDLVQGDYHYVQFFNILMRRCLEHLNLQLVGRNYFDAASRVEVREHRIDLWPGYLTSIRQHEREILMCADITHKVMRNQTLLDVLRESYSTNRDNYQNIFKNTVIGGVVLTDYNNRTYRVDDVDFRSTPNSTFKMRDGTDMSYANYYKQRYQINIKDMRQPLLVSRSKARDRRAGQDELIYLIPELCRSTGLTDAMRNDFRLMKALADHTRVPPEQRIKKLMNFSQRLRGKREILEEFAKWNFQLDNNLIDLPGRIIQSQTLYFGKKRTLTPKNADWNFDLQTQPQLIAPKLSQWVAIVPDKNVSDAQNFLKELMSISAATGFEVARPRILTIPNDRCETYSDVLKKETDKSNPQLIFCVVSNNQAMRYQTIKKKLCVDRPIPSQVVLARTLTQKSPSMLRAVCNKVSVQINSKVGGTPWTVDVGGLLPNLMVIGFDVCHEKSSSKADFGAMVASLDVNFGQYFSAVSRHSSGEELSNDLALHVGQAILAYRKKNGNRLPNPIIIYRDGVGEGQSPFVHDYEVLQVKKKLTEMYGGPDRFKLGFIIVTKRINTRIFLNNKNPPPGTVVDDVITDPLKYDFFLVSQSVRQGTVAPTAYNIIEDNTGLDAGKIQKLTYKFCHMYYNFSGTVRVPAPCQYAHKLAFFASQTLQQTPHPNLQQLLYFL